MRGSRVGSIWWTRRELRCTRSQFVVDLRVFGMLREARIHGVFGFYPCVHSVKARCAVYQGNKENGPH
jgi:hypothetical protein